MTPESMRIVTPCSENLDAMEKTERGFFCDKCQHDVVDLRRTPKKKALKVLSALRAEALRDPKSGGKVCVRVMARADRVPVFAPDPPSAFARLAGPIALATSLAACAPSSHESTTTVAAVVHETTGGTSTTNNNGRVVSPAVVGVVSGNPQTPPTDLVAFDPPVDVAGGLAYSP